jgi:uncharacterized membrane protein
MRIAAPPSAGPLHVTGKPASTMTPTKTSEQKPPVHSVENTTLGLERIPFFSDAVIAIAITLLALEIRLPPVAEGESLWVALGALWPSYMSFAISFLVIGTYWIAHHKMFEYIDRYDRGLLWLNLLFLLCVAFTPFPTAVVGDYGLRTDGQIFYAASIFATGLTKHILWMYASHKGRLLKSGVTATQIRNVTLRGYVTPLVFLISIPFAFLHPVAPIIIWSCTPFVFTRVLLAFNK